MFSDSGVAVILVLAIGAPNFAYSQGTQTSTAQKPRLDTSGYHRGSLDRDKVDEILVNRLKTVARNLITDSIGRAFSTESAALKLVIEDTLGGIKDLRGRQLFDRILADMLVLLFTVAEADTLGRDAICDGRTVRKADEIEKNLNNLAIELRSRISEYPGETKAPLEVRVFSEAKFQAEIKEWAGSADAEKACDTGAAWRLLRSLRTPTSDGPIEAQWLLLNLGFEHVIRVVRSASDAAEKLTLHHFVRRHWGLSSDQMKSTIETQLGDLGTAKTIAQASLNTAAAQEVVALDKTINFMGLRDFANLLPDDKRESATTEANMASTPTLVCQKSTPYCSLLTATLPDGEMAIQSALRLLLVNRFGDFIRAMVRDDLARQLIDVYDHFLQFVSADADGIAVDTESFLVSFYKNYNTRGHFRFYLGVGATPSVLYQPNDDSIAAPVIYSEKIGLQLAWSDATVGQTDVEFHTNLYAGGLLYSLAVAATDDDSNPFKASALVGIDPVGVTIYQAIEVNLATFVLVPFAGDDRVALGLGLNLAVPLHDYLATLD